MHVLTKRSYNIYIKIIFGLLSILLFSSCLTSHHESVKKSSFDDLKLFYKVYQTDDQKLDISLLQNNKQIAFDSLYDKLRTLDISDKDSSFIKAYYLNLYNMSFHQQMLEKAPMSEINGSFFLEKFIVHEGKNYSLASLLQQKLMPLFPSGDALFLIHYGSIHDKTPSLIVYDEHDVSHQINDQLKKTLNDPDFIRVKPLSHRIQVPEIFRWYSTIFSSKEVVRSYINAHRTAPLPDDGYELEYYPWSWKTNL